MKLAPSWAQEHCAACQGLKAVLAPQRFSVGMHFVFGVLVYRTIGLFLSASRTGASLEVATDIEVAAFIVDGMFAIASVFATALFLLRRARGLILTRALMAGFLLLDALVVLTAEVDPAYRSAAWAGFAFRMGLSLVALTYLFASPYVRKVFQLSEPRTDA